MTQRPRIGGHLLLAVVVRVLVNTALRMVYPFLPAFARGTGAEVDVLARLVALRGFAGVASPLLGGASDRFGRGVVLAAATALFAAACLLPWLWPSVAALGASILLVGVAKSAFDPAFHGLLADEIPYARRGLAVGLAETSWALALLVGAPAVAWALARPAASWPLLGPRPAWTLPLAVLGLTGAAGATALALAARRRPAPAAPDDALARPPASALAAPKLLRDHASVRAAALYCLLATAGVEAVLIALGPWLEDAHGLSLAGLGVAAVAIGVAELAGELGTGPLVDRFGKRRIVTACALACGALMAVLPLAGGRAPALAVLAAAFVAYEMAIVGAIPIVGELVPSRRAAVLSLAVAAMSLGRGFGALLGNALWSAGGIAAVGPGAALVLAAAAATLARGIAEPTVEAGL